MRYPKIIRKMNDALGFFAGFLVFLLAIMLTANSIGRYFLASPIIWAADMSRYMLIYIVFLGASFNFQNKGHVGVDLVTNVITKGRPRLQRALRIVAYLLCLPFILVITYRGYVMMTAAIAINRMTTAIFQVPLWILLLAIVLGGILMTVTVVFIILSLIAGEDDWLKA